jgi:hypothetical protein
MINEYPPTKPNLFERLSLNWSSWVSEERCNVIRSHSSL